MELLAAFAEIGRLEPGGPPYAQLHGVPAACDEVVSADWAQSVSEQAARFLAAHEQEIGEHTQWILATLAGIGEP
jgi:hypothetical protein